jgi:3-isopropylmalate/(R)-2-methylmalate dehydratase small subunit
MSAAIDSRITKITGTAVPVLGDDVDTDRIMPARFLKCVTFDKLGQELFKDVRVDPTTGETTGHPLNDPKFAEAQIMIVNKNFGCGSSREHAPQGILRAGFKALIGESFAEIFAGNCTAIGLVAVTTTAENVRKLSAAAQKNPSLPFAIDLVQKTVAYGGDVMAVEMKDSARTMFLEGTWDTTATLLAAKDAVESTAQKIPYVQWMKARA